MSTQLDPITFEVIKNALSSVADEMALIVMRSAYSPVVRDTMDYSTALCDRNGQIIAQGLTLAVQLGSFPDSMRILLADHAPTARPDDVFLYNDPYGSGGPNASFALITRNYMRHYGATREDFGKICVAQRANALRFPHALMKKPLTLDEYLSARAISDPIHLFDCVMPCAGAEAFLVCREDAARSLGLPVARLLATVERHNAFPEDPIQYRGGWAMDVSELYAMAGVTAEDVDFVETYDDYPVICMMQIEDLGFCAKGESPEFIRSHTLTADGSFPHNTSGGQLSVGQAGAAGGFLGLVEALRQLTGSVLGAEVPDAKIGLVSGFGMVTYERGLASGAALLSGGRA